MPSIWMMNPVQRRAPKCFTFHSHEEEIKTDTRHIHSAHKTTKRSVLTEVNSKVKSNVDSMWERGRDSARGH
eukprot:scaffold14916_cov128-Isochrysis_galbana.AAC.12